MLEPQAIHHHNFFLEIFYHRFNLARPSVELTFQRFQPFAAVIYGKSSVVDLPAVRRCLSNVFFIRPAGGASRHQTKGESTKKPWTQNNSTQNQAPDGTSSKPFLPPVTLKYFASEALDSTCPRQCKTMRNVHNMNHIICFFVEVSKGIQVAVCGKTGAILAGCNTVPTVC